MSIIENISKKYSTKIGLCENDKINYVLYKLYSEAKFRDGKHNQNLLSDLLNSGDKLYFRTLKNEKINEINAYDYSIAYTDSFLSDLTNNIPKNKNIVLVYISDHGESTIGKFYHDSIKEMHYDMFAIPMFVWFSDSFMQQYPSIVEKVRSISQRYFTNDRIYDLLTFIESGEGDVM